jgi:hypothetical protein
MSKIQCPWCGARLRIDEAAGGHGIQCSSCQRQFDVSIVDGTFVFAPPLVLPGVSARGRKLKQKRDWISVLPVLVAVTAIGVVVAVCVLLWSHDGKGVRKSKQARAESSVKASIVKRSEARQDLPKARKQNLNKTQQVVQREASERVAAAEVAVPTTGR